MFTNSSLVYAHSKNLLLQFNERTCSFFLGLDRKNSHTMASAARTAVLRHADSSHSPLLLAPLPFIRYHSQNHNP
jgi:hypothetical protein